MNNNVDLTKFPHFVSGSDAMYDFLKATNETPVVGQTTWQFTCPARDNTAAEAFVQAMRSALSKQRRKLKKTGIQPQIFTVQIVSIVINDNGTALIALGRRQSYKPVKDSFNFEMVKLLAHPDARQSKRWFAFMESLNETSESYIRVEDWEMVCVAVLAILQNEAVYKGFDDESNAYIVSKF